MAQLPEPFRLRIALEAGSGVCLWAANPPVHARFGYAVRVDDLPIGADTAAAITVLIARHDAAADPDFDPEGLTGPTLFGGEPAARPFADEIEALRRRLQDELGPDFLVEHDFEPDAGPAVFSWNRRWTLKAAVFSLPMAALCLWFTYVLAFEGFGDFGGSHRAILAAMFGAFGLLFLASAVTYALASRDPSPVVVIDAAGVLDRRLSRAATPWDRIESVTPIQNGGQLMLALNLDRPKTMPLPRNPLWRINRLSARLIGQPELAVKLTGLAADLPGLLAAVTRRRG